MEHDLVQQPPIHKMQAAQRSGHPNPHSKPTWRQRIGESSKYSRGRTQDSPENQARCAKKKRENHENG